MKLTKYNNYKNTNIHWLGDIPEHWELKRNKSIFFEVSNLSKTGKETLLTVSHITGVTPRSEKNVNMFLAETMEGYKICKKGDLIINTMWAWMGALGTSKYEGICSPAYNIYRSRKWVNIDPRFFDYLYRTPMFIKEMTRYSKGIVESRLRLYPKDFFQINTGLPPLSEQTVIANYLDQKTAQIDKKVDLLSQKIEKYKELKKSLINETVCRGLDKNVRLKPSGINWIGDIPEHWEVKRVKEMFDVGRGRAISQNELIEGGRYPVFSSQTENYGCLGYINTYDFNTNLLTWTTDGVNAGTVFMRSGKFNCTNICGTLFPNSKTIELEFMKYSVQESTKHNKRIDTNGAKIMSNEMRIIFVVHPPFTEQIAIAEYLDEKTSKIDQITANLSQQIEALKELRKTLINEVVTGKVRVID